MTPLAMTQFRRIGFERHHMAVLAGLLAVSIFLLVWRLDGTILWRDEASTGAWARIMVERKLLIPRVFDGRILAVQGADGHDFNEDLSPSVQGWLQFYVAALSFKVLG